MWCRVSQQRHVTEAIFWSIASTGGTTLRCELMMFTLSISLFARSACYLMIYGPSAMEKSKYEMTLQRQACVNLDSFAWSPSIATFAGAF